MLVDKKCKHKSRNCTRCYERSSVKFFYEKTAYRRISLKISVSQRMPSRSNSWSIRPVMRSAPGYLHTLTCRWRRRLNVKRNWTFLEDAPPKVRLFPYHHVSSDRQRELIVTAGWERGEISLCLSIRSSLSQVWQRGWHDWRDSRSARVTQFLLHAIITVTIFAKNTEGTHSLPTFAQIAICEREGVTGAAAVVDILRWDVSW